jgi:hypothetical protein
LQQAAPEVVIDAAGVDVQQLAAKLLQQPRLAASRQTDEGAVLDQKMLRGVGCVAGDSFPHVPKSLPAGRSAVFALWSRKLTRVGGASH